MNKISWLSVPLSALVLAVALARADTDADTAVERVKSAQFFARPDSPDHFKYAPDREVQVRHLALDITPDFKQRTIRDTATLSLKPLLKPVEEIKLDAVELSIDSVSASEKIRGYQSTDDHLVITFADPNLIDLSCFTNRFYRAWLAP